MPVPRPPSLEEIQAIEEAARRDGYEAGLAQGQLPMLPPTVAVLDDLAGHRNVNDALEWARARRILPLMPRARVVGERLDWVLVHAYTGEVLRESSEPAGSEERGAS